MKKDILVKLCDGREIPFQTDYEYQHEGFIFPTDVGYRILSSGTILYVREHTGAKLFEPTWANGTDIYFRTEVRLLNLQPSFKFKHARKTRGTHGYWRLTDFDGGYEYWFPCASVLEITEDGPHRARYPKESKGSKKG